MSIEEIRKIHYTNEGKAEGKAEGKTEERRQLAEEMIRDGEPIEKTIKYSKLTKKEINELKNEVLQNIL